MRYFVHSINIKDRGVLKMTNENQNDINNQTSCNSSSDNTQEIDREVHPFDDVKTSSPKIEMKYLSKDKNDREQKTNK